MSKEIKVRCKGADEIEYRELENMQGELKELTKEAFNSLKRSLKKYGIIKPLAVWQNKKDNDKMMLEDGVQRVKVFEELEIEGYKIPKVPIIWVYADSLKEAKEILIMYNSNNGRITEKGFYEFLELGDIKIDDINMAYNPDINYIIHSENINPEELQNPNWADEWKDMPEFVANDRKSFRTVIVHFEKEEYLEEFIKITKLQITPTTKYIWYPKKPEEQVKSSKKGYVDES